MSIPDFATIWLLSLVSRLYVMVARLVWCGYFKCSTCSGFKYYISCKNVLSLHMVGCVALSSFCCC